MKAQTAILGFLSAITIAGFAPSASAQCVLHQNVPATTGAMAAFNQLDLAQSFQHTIGSICGAGVLLTPNWGSSDTVRIALWTGLPNAGGTIITSGSAMGTQGTWVDVTWPSVAITPGTTYYLVFDGNFTLAIEGSVNNPYPFGQVYANPGYGSFPTFDYSFRTNSGASCATPVIYCTAKINSLGCTPSISSTGASSASAGSGFVIKGSNVRNQKPGLLLYTNNGRASGAFQGGVLCVAGPIRRTVALNSNGTPLPGSDCTGVYSVDMNTFATGGLGGLPAAYLIVAGTLVDTQFWGRDPGFPAPNNSTLSNGLEYTVCP
ncbi:MAG: hypothetical protein ABI054_04975 [Planctomycetota bacterium]